MICVFDASMQMCRYSSRLHVKCSMLSYGVYGITEIEHSAGHSQEIARFGD